MRGIVSKGLLLGALCCIGVFQPAPHAAAADLAVTPASARSATVTRLKRPAIRHAARLVVDLDGTAIVLRPEFPSGYEAIPITGSTAPSRYLNGQPVRPHVPRGWPRQVMLVR